MTVIFEGCRNIASREAKCLSWYVSKY